MREKPENNALREGLMAEHKILREELMWHLEHSQKALTHFLVLVSVLIGYGLAQDSPWLFVIAWFINLEYWRQHMAQRDCVAKISRYIAMFIEPCAPGLNWEGRVSQAHMIAVRRGVPIWQELGDRVRRTLLGPHSVLAIACLFLTVHQGLRPIFGLTTFSTILLLAAAFLLHLLIACRRLIKSYHNLRATWDGVWGEVNDHEQHTGDEPDSPA